MQNLVILIGNLGRDPEVRYTPDGVPVCNFSMATEETWTKRDSGEKQKKTTWHNIVLWRKLAETAGQYLKKGDRIYLQGKIQIREYDDKDGIKRRAFEIVGDVMKMLGSTNGNGGEQHETAPAQPQAQTEQPAQPQQEKQSAAAPTGDGAYGGGPPLGGDDDDLPF